MSAYLSGLRDLRDLFLLLDPGWQIAAFTLGVIIFVLIAVALWETGALVLAAVRAPWEEEDGPHEIPPADLDYGTRLRAHLEAERARERGLDAIMQARTTHPADRQYPELVRKGQAS
jgi:hypothetical protein